MPGRAVPRAVLARSHLHGERSAMPMIWRFIGTMLIAFVLGIFWLPPAPAAAQGNGTVLVVSTNGQTVSSSNQSSAILLNVDAPANGTSVSNGQSVDIGGWSSGSQVIVNLDSANGTLAGQSAVHKPRPDVAQVFS